MIMPGDRPPASIVDPGAMRALVVDDSATVRALLVELLREEGFAVRAVTNGTEAIADARTHEPDIVLLDLTLPGLDGIAVCERIRSFSDAYILMLTARTDEADKLIGLSSGADDYLTKPFSPRELLARVRAILRRPRSTAGRERASELAPDAHLRQFGYLRIDPVGHRAWCDEREVALTKIEFSLLEALSRRPGQTLTRSTLLERVWGGAWHGSEHAISVHMSNLRRKLERDVPGPPLIKTVRGIGYRFDPPEN